MSVDDGRYDTCSKPLHGVEEAFELTGMMSSDESTTLRVSGMAFGSEACEQRDDRAPQDSALGLPCRRRILSP
jgi:hypothetical protein